MCGIVGIINRQASVDSQKLRKAIGLLYKRGPDDSGMWMEENVGLGHSRLAILDLTSAAHQPMISMDKRFVIVFNGEIYNFKSLRLQLSDSDARWQSHSDTEVILAAYTKWGVNCVNHFHGMFAFAIWDRSEKKLFAARDRMGVKPFYYHFSSGNLSFASRPRALCMFNHSLSNEIDEQALRFYLESGYFPASLSIHPDICKLPPAHYLLLDDKELKVERYWSFQHIVPEVSWENRHEEDLLDELDEIVSRIVCSRMISDVPLGAFLSGGIDSSLVVAMMAKHSSLPIKTFTIGFDEKAYDESLHANAVSNYLGTEHYCEHLKVDDLLQLLPTFQEEYDEPFFDSSAFPTLAVSRLARKYVTVSLSGDGGDELFGGYHYYKIAQQLAPFFSLPKNFRSLIASLIGLLPNHRLKLLSGALRQDNHIGAFAFSRSIAKDFDKVLLPEVLGRTQGLHELFSKASLLFPSNLQASEKGMRLDALFTLPDDYLQKVDIGSMAFSLESREPLLDQELVEWSMRLPLKWKLNKGTNKYLLRKLAYRYVPSDILDRPKQGFAVPIDKWLRGPLKQWAIERIECSELFHEIPIDQAKVRRLFDLHLSRKRNVHPILWAILMLLDFKANQKKFMSCGKTDLPSGVRVA